MLKATNKPVDCSATKSRAHTLQFPGAHTYRNHRWAGRLCLSTLTAKWFQIPGQSLNICTVWLISPKKPHEDDLRLPFSGDCLADPPLTGKPPKLLVSARVPGIGLQTWDQSNCPGLTDHGLVPLCCGCAREPKHTHKNLGFWRVMVAGAVGLAGAGMRPPHTEGKLVTDENLHSSKCYILRGRLCWENPSWPGNF